MVNPSNKRNSDRRRGTGLAGASAAATLANSVIRSMPTFRLARRAIQYRSGGINAQKLSKGRRFSEQLFIDTTRVVTFVTRANVHRLARWSTSLIKWSPRRALCADGRLSRIVWGCQVSNLYARGQTGQQLLLGAYQQLSRQLAWRCAPFNRTELIDTVADGRCAGVVVRDFAHRRSESHAAHAVVLATGGYGNVLLVDQCHELQCHGGGRIAEVQCSPIRVTKHPTCIPQSGEDQQNSL